MKEPEVIIRVLGKSALIEEFGEKTALEIIERINSGEQAKEFVRIQAECRTIQELAIRVYPLGLFVYDGVDHLVYSKGGPPTIYKPSKKTGAQE